MCVFWFVKPPPHLFLFLFCFVITPLTLVRVEYLVGISAQCAFQPVPNCECFYFPLGFASLCCLLFYLRDFVFDWCGLKSSFFLSILSFCKHLP